MPARKAKKKAPSSGYSGTPLLQKLGIAAGMRVAILGAPARLPPALARVNAQARLGGAPFDVIVQFADVRADLARSFPIAAKNLSKHGGLWIAWPKKASGVATDVTEDVVRRIALDTGLVDNKVCAIDEVWSGLRCVYRLADR